MRRTAGTMKSLGIIMLLMCLLAARPSYGYIGPGLGAGTIGLVLGVIASVGLALFAVVWYPVKRMLRKRKDRKDTTDPQEPE